MKLLPWLLISGCVLVFDQATKYWAEHILRFDTVTVFSWLDFSLAHNRGAAFSFLSGAGGWQHFVFGGLAIVVSLLLIYWITKLGRHERQLALAYAFIIGGAIGNVIDRAIYQYVVDFIHVFYGDWHFPYFNIADSAISIGAALLICEAFNFKFLNSRQAIK